MKLSYVIVTRNRRDTLLRTLALLEHNTWLPRESWEVFVVDNASDDGTPEAVARLHRQAHLIRLPENEGVPARNHAIRPAQGRFIVFLDDDSYPLDDAIPRSLAYMSRHPRTAALVARVILPDGSAEAPAMPAVTLGGASVIRRSVLEEVGGFAPEFFRQAEEYDLSFRIWAAGYRIERFEDICFGHDKVSGGRSSSLTRRMDLRNNLIVAERYLPRPMRREYRHDWLRRYAALGVHDGHRDSITTAIHESRVWARREMKVGRKTLKPETLEILFQWGAQANAVLEWTHAHNIKRPAIADLSKNIFATFRACQLAKTPAASILENAPAFAGSKYRGLLVIEDSRAVAGSFDGIVLSTISPARVDGRMMELASRFSVPILRLWEPKILGQLTTQPRRPPVIVPSDPRAA